MRDPDDFDEYERGPEDFHRPWGPPPPPPPWGPPPFWGPFGGLGCLIGLLPFLILALMLLRPH